jgi:hypothetical protein
VYVINSVAGGPLALADHPLITKKFSICDLSKLSSLEKYVGIAESISRDQKMEVFTKQILGLNQGRSEYSPFGFICGSSGTGKTNMVFATHVPFVYFLLSTKSDQDVYQCYKEQSMYLQTLVKEDYENFESEMRVLEPNNCTNITVNLVEKSKQSYRSVGFLVSMVKLVSALWKMYGGNVNPALIQVAITSLQFQPMSFEEARMEIQGFLKKEDICRYDPPPPSDPDPQQRTRQSSYYTFPIFFDECVEIGGNDVGEFLFLKNAIRCMLCVPIFMGTDARPSNFLGTSPLYANRGSRDELREYFVWCLIWHQMPGLDCEYVSSKLGSLERKVIESNLIVPSANVFEFLKKWLVKERPLFLNYVVDYVERLCSSNEVPGSDYAFLKLMFVELLRKYRIAKNHMTDSTWSFNIGQVSYMSSLFWDTDLVIHKHLARIRATPYDPNNPYYSKLSASIESGSRYVRHYIVKNRLPLPFKMVSEYEPFLSNPLLGLVIAGLDSNNQGVLSRSVPNETITPRISTIHSMFDSALNMPLPMTPSFSSPRNSGTVLEHALLSATILASRVGSLHGTTVKDFLGHLCWELDFNGMMPGSVLELTSVDERFLEAFAAFKVPFISPMAGQCWDPAFVRELSDGCGVETPCLGVAFPSVSSNARADLAVSLWAPDSTDSATGSLNKLPEDLVLVGQCKMYQARINTGDLKEICKSFDTFEKCNLFLVVAFEFTKLVKKQVSELQNNRYRLWKVSRIQDCEELKLEEVVGSEQSSAGLDRHVVLIGLSEVGSGNVDSFNEFKNTLMGKVEQRVGSSKRTNSQSARKPSTRKRGRNS